MGRRIEESHMGRRLSSIVVLVVALALGASGVANAAAKVKKPRHGPAGTAFYTPPSPIPGAKHGDLIWSRTLTGASVLPGASANQLVLYRSTSTAGATVAVSGTVTIPKGKAPKGGWPIITWAHGTTGIADVCAPSLDSATNPAHGNDAYIYPLETAWVKAGYAVVRTDYEGLGTPGIHPYLIGTSEGRSVLDIVRAARQLDPALSKNVVISGHSQGGQSALWAASLAPTWTPELDVKGTVAFAPVSHLEDQTGNLSSVSITSLSGLVAMIFRGIDVASPAVNVPSLLSAQAAALYPQTLTECLTQLDAPDSYGALPLNQFLAPNADITAATAVLAANDPSRLHIHTPVLMEQGLGDTTVFPTFTMQLQANLVANGVDSTLHTYAGVTHGGIVTGASATDATKEIEKLLPAK
jgi:pimeloyl-ACP methyl ester carboxylesterase